MTATFDRRQILRAALIAGAGLSVPGLFPAWARSGTGGISSGMPSLSGEDIALTVGESHFTVGGRAGHAVTINGSLPAPLIRLREGQDVRIAVTNTLSEDTSIHWHGVLLPFDMDGVPGVSFPGIRPGETFVYEFPIRHAGTFWYHSHSGMQEQLGHYGPLVFDPAGPDPVRYDREHVIVLSDWTFMHPHRIMQKLKQEPGYFNYQRLTLSGLVGDGGPAEQMPLAERLAWQRMRMDPTDIADVTASTYSYLVNGHGLDENWTGLFRPHERVRLRFINASSMTVFNVRIPGLPMTVVNADGNDVRPVEVDEFQISVAETYDVVVQPTEDRAFTLVAESVDRSGMARGTLAPRSGMTAAVPPLRPRPILGMDAMGMQHHGSMSGPGHGDGAHEDGSHADRTAGTHHDSADQDQHDAAGRMNAGAMNMGDVPVPPGLPGSLAPGSWPAGSAPVRLRTRRSRVPFRQGGPDRTGGSRVRFAAHA